MSMMYVDCRASSSNEEPVRVIAVLDSQNDELIISQLLPYQPPANPYKGKTKEQVAMMKEIKAHTVVAVDNMNAFREWDMCFDPVEHLDAAIRAYYSFQRLGRLKIDSTIAALCDPGQMIEVRKTDLKGNVYELNSGEVNNNHFAVLISCWCAEKMAATRRITEADVEPTQRDIDTFNVPFSV